MKGNFELDLPFHFTMDLSFSLSFCSNRSSSRHRSVEIQEAATEGLIITFQSGAFPLVCQMDTHS